LTVSLATESYLAQRETWPTSGHHILAHATQRQHLAGDLRELVTPVERVYVPEDEAIRARIGIDA
jgi:hypothetical protein